jgi:integrase
MHVRHITREHVMQVLEPIWSSKTETASRLRGRIESILDWSRVKGYRSGENPALWRGNLDHLLAKPSTVKPVQHHAALPYREMGVFMTTMRAIDGVAARCLDFTILTASRSGEARGARWTEVDLDTGVWRVPAERMKEKKEHRVALSTAAVQLLRALPRRADCDFVFPSPRGKVLSDMTLLMIVRRLGAPATPHGMRSTFKDWASEMTSHPRELIEVALAHVPGDSSEMAYWRGDVLERRRQLMEDWAQFISRPFKSGSVVPLQRQA